MTAGIIRVRVSIEGGSDMRKYGMLQRAGMREGGLPLPPAFQYRKHAIITRGLYTFSPLFEVHLCTVNFGLIYG